MTASLHPVAGDPRALLGLLRAWIDADAPDPLVVRTSGSTGAPKDVVLSRDAVVTSARASLDRLGGPGRWVLAIPPTGVGGLQVLVRSVLAGVEPVVAAEHADLPAAVGALAGARRYASLVPTQLHRLAEEGRLGSLASLDAVLVGGAAVPAATADAARAAGVRVVRTYGMSETAGGCVYDGVPLDGVGVRLDADGQVLISGPVLFDGYADDPEATASALHDGWFRTADLGEVGPDGRLRVTGRVDDVVVSGGVNVPLPAVTAALRLLDGVRDAAAVGVPDDEWGTRVVAFVVPSDSVCLDALRLDEVRDGVEDHGVARAWAPREVVLVDELPLLPGGKLDRQALVRGVSSGGRTLE